MSEGWLYSALEENELGPKQKYVRFLINKSWEKRYKPEKIYTILSAFIIKNIENSLMILKSLIFIDIYLEKGSPECIISKKYKNPPAKILLKINKSWKKIFESNI